MNNSTKATIVVMIAYYSLWGCVAYVAKKNAKMWSKTQLETDD